MALLSRCAVALVWLAWGCADARVGDLRLQHQEEAEPPSPRKGWAFASADSSRFDDGMLIYGEFRTEAGTLGIVEFDLPKDEGTAPRLRYQERRDGRVTFDGHAVAGSVMAPRELPEEDCACGAVDFALRFESESGERRSLDKARVALAGDDCVRTAQLENARPEADADAAVEVQFIEACPQPEALIDTGPPRGSESRDEPEDTSPTAIVLVNTTESSDGCTYGDDGYDDSDLGCDTQSAPSSDSAGCEGGDTSSASGCEADDTTSASGCEGDSDTTSSGSSSGCEADDGQSDACESDTLAWLPPLRRRRPPGALDPQERSGLTVALALLIPWWRGRRRW